MKPTFLFCLVLIATYYSAAAITKSEILALLQQDYTVDKVLELFKALQAQESSDLSTIDTNYPGDVEALQGEISRTQDLLDQKTAECNGVEDVLNGQKAEKQRLEDNVASAQNTIASNIDKVKALEDARCAANLLYIERLAQNQEASQFLSYLRGKVSDPNFAGYLSNNPEALLQIKDAFAGKKTDEILSMLTQHHLLSLLQQDYQGEDSFTYDQRARTDEEIGTGHVDNDRGVMTRAEIHGTEYNVQEYVDQLVGYIDQLLAEFKRSSDDLQAAEQQAVQALIDYRNKVSDENYVLNRFIEATSSRITELSGDIANNEKALDECRAQIPPLVDGRQVAQANHDSYVEHYNARRENLVNTISLLDQVIQVYTDEVVNVAGSQYRERTEDYLGDQTFDQTGGFTARGSVEAIGSYGG